MIKAALTKALEWSDLSIKLDREDPEKPKSEGESLENVNLQLVDTKANLLYKLGRVQEGIALEEKAVELDNENAKKAGREDFVSGYAEYVDKMKKGLPTWPVKK